MAPKQGGQKSSKGFPAQGGTPKKRKASPTPTKYAPKGQPRGK